jgi:hypothetical protein
VKIIMFLCLRLSETSRRRKAPIESLRFQTERTLETVRNDSPQEGYGSH